MLTSTPKRPPPSWQRSRSLSLKSALIGCGLRLVSLSRDVQRAFTSSGVQVDVVCPQQVLAFFKNYKQADSGCMLGSLPIDLRATPLRDEATLATVLRYCLRDVNADLEGLPLLLCADGQLREFSGDEQVFLSEFSDLLPHCNSMFVHATVARTCFADMDADTSPFFNRFDITAFANLLPNVVSEAWYRKEDEHAEWIEEDAPPTTEWVCRVWHFLRSAFDDVMSAQGDDVIEESVLRGMLRPLELWCLLPAEVKVSVF